MNALRLVLGKCCYKFNAVCYMEVKFLFKKDVKIGLGPGFEPGTSGSTVLRYITKTDVNCYITTISRTEFR